MPDEERRGLVHLMVLHVEIQVVQKAWLMVIDPRVDEYTALEVANVGEVHWASHLAEEGCSAPGKALEEVDKDSQILQVDDMAGDVHKQAVAGLEVHHS